MYLFTSQIAQLKGFLTVTRGLPVIFGKMRDLLSKATLTTVTDGKDTRNTTKETDSSIRFKRRAPPSL